MLKKLSIHRLGIFFLLALLLLVVGCLAHGAVFRPPTADSSYGISLAMDGSRLLVSANNVWYWYDNPSDPSAQPRLLRFPGDMDTLPAAQSHSPHVTTAPTTPS